MLDFAFPHCRSYGASVAERGALSLRSGPVLEVSVWSTEGISLPGRPPYSRGGKLQCSRATSRLRLHDAKLIKDRRYHLRTYPNCFVAKELADWLMEHKEAPDRETAIRVMQKLMDYNIIHHVCDEHSEYKDAKLLYRFRKDDGTFPLNKEVKVFLRGQGLYETMMTGKEASILKVREQGSERYHRTFPGCEMLDWLVKEGEVRSREEAEELCRALLEHGVIQQVTGRHHFSDSDLLFQFRVNFRRRRRLTELLSENLLPSLHESPDSPESPFCLRKLSAELTNASFLSGENGWDDLWVGIASRDWLMKRCSAGL
ncbi:hypothetical protein FKM82_007614 [Ascaphus truei]